jgi:hypothetical protein
MPKWTFWLQSLQPVCKLSEPSWDTFAARPDALTNAQPREHTFASRPDALTDVEVQDLPLVAPSEPS